MRPGDTIVIEAVENGWLVRMDYPRDAPWCVREFIVFNDMGYAAGAGDECRDCLLKFIERHFGERPASSADAGNT